VRRLIGQKHYMIAVWRGEWHEYYISWRHQYDNNSFTMTDGFVFMMVFIFIGLVPLLIWWLIVSVRRRAITPKHVGIISLK
jgi:hypothetical protein